MLEDPTLIDAVGTVTAAGVLYLCRIGRNVLMTVEDHDTLIYGTEAEDGYDGLAALAVEADKRSRRNRQRLEDEPAIADGGERLEVDDDPR